MRIRKRTPARAADPGPAPALSASPPRHHPKERSHEEEAEEEKRVILVATGVGVQEEEEEEEGDRVPAAAASNDSSAMDDDVPKPKLQPQAAAQCNRNDGKRWRCKGAAVPGYLFCDRHIAWSSRKRKPRPRKHEQQHGRGGGDLGPATAKDDAASAEEDTATEQPGHDDGGFQKRAKGGGVPGPAA